MLEAGKSTPSLLTSVLYRQGQVPIGGILKLYLFSNTNKWFLNLIPDIPEAVLKSLHGTKLDVKIEGVTKEMEQLDNGDKRWQPLVAINPHSRRCEKTIGNDYRE